MAVGHGSPTLAHRSRLPSPPSSSFPPSLIPLSCSSLIAFTALLISQIGLIDWIWFLWIEQLYWVAFSLMDRSVWVCVFVTRMHACMLGMIKENFLSPSLSFCNPAAIPLLGIPAAGSLQIHTCSLGPSDGCVLSEFFIMGGSYWLRSLLIVATPWVRQH